MTKVYLVRYYSSDGIWEWRQVESLTRGLRECRLVDRELATVLLGCNVLQRRLDVVRVLSYAEEMKAGRWGEIKRQECLLMTNAEVLLNGQHRLWAVLMSGSAELLPIVWGARKWEECWQCFPEFNT